MSAITYAELASKLTSKGTKKLANNTWARRLEDGSIAVRLHSTDVATVRPDDTVVLNTDGWLTLTTRTRMNWFAGVYQRDGEWFVQSGNQAIPFRDGMVVDIPTQTVIAGAPPMEQIELERAHNREVDRLIRNYLRGLTAGRWEAVKQSVHGSVAGDCWFCSMRVEGTGQTWGDMRGDGDHLRSHLEERYYMVTLVYNALLDKGYRDPQFVLWHGSLDMIHNALRRHFRLRLYVGTKTPGAGRPRVMSTR